MDTLTHKYTNEKQRQSGYTDTQIHEREIETKWIYTDTQIHERETETKWISGADPGFVGRRGVWGPLLCPQRVEGRALVGGPGGLSSPEALGV